MVKKLRKAFTIVELVIVIAVIAILAAVLIPTVSSLIEKANVSNDTQVVREMNTALSAESVEEVPQKMEDVLAILDEYGFDMAKLNPSTKGYLYVWEKTSNQILLMDGEGAVAYHVKDYDPSAWELIVPVANEQTAETVCDYSAAVSVYLTQDLSYDFSFANVVTFTVASGKTLVGNVTMSGANAAVAAVSGNISGTLTIDNANAEVSHYGAVSAVDLKAVKDASYHEYGTVQNGITIAQGRAVLEETANVSSVFVVDSADGAEKNVALEMKSKVTAAVVDVQSSKNTVSITKEDSAKGIYYSGESSKVTAPDNSEKILINSLQDIPQAGIVSGYYVLNTDLRDVPAALEVQEGSDVVIDLNGHTYSVGLQSEGRHFYAINNYGYLSINDFSEAQTGTIRARGVRNLGNGELVVNSGTIVSVDENGGACVWNEGDLIINGGTFRTEYVGTPNDNYGIGCVNNSGTAVIYAGIFEDVNRRTYAIISTGEIEISPLKDSDVVVSGAHGALAVDSGVAVVNGGLYSSTDYYGLYVSNDGMGTDPMQAAVTVNGGVFDGKSYSVWVGSDYNNPVNSTVCIKGGTFEKPLNAQSNTRPGAVIVEGGSFVEIDEKYVSLGCVVVKDGDYYRVVAE